MRTRHLLANPVTYDQFVFTVRYIIVTRKKFDEVNNPNQNTPGVKKVAAKNLRKGHAEKDVKSKWAAKASCC